jgi:hypothetical protein
LDCVQDRGVGHDWQVGSGRIFRVGDEGMHELILPMIKYVIMGKIEEVEGL